jgi:phosphohistidine phosphatase
MANLIFWRHAEAEEASVSGHDADRVLSRRGRKDAATMARWLQQQLPERCEILSSPARRCLETAAALAQMSSTKKQYVVNIAQFLATDASVAVMAEKLLNADSSQTIVVIGHQPQLGQLIAKILGMAEAACVVKKGAVWWLRQRANGEIAIDTSGKLAAEKLQLYLFAVKPPRY